MKQLLYEQMAERDSDRSKSSCTFINGNRIELICLCSLPFFSTEGLIHSFLGQKKISGHTLEYGTWIRIK